MGPLYMEVMSGGKEIILNVVRLCKMQVPPNEAFNMNESRHLMIGYLLKDE